MSDEFSKFFDAAKALILYADSEHVFDRSADMGCGGFDTFQSETLYDLIKEAKKALSEFEEARSK